MHRRDPLGIEHAVQSHAGPDWRRVRRRVLIALAIAGGLIAALLAAGAVYVASLPGVGDAEARVQRIVSEHHGVYGGGPPPLRLGEAVVSVEDEHFYSNFLINILSGVGRAALAAVQASQDPGGSTIQQQLAKELYGDGGGLGSTLREIGLGIKLSLQYSRAEILSMYLNSVYYGNGYWGYVTAAHGYFGTSPGRLGWAEAAMLAGLPQAPSAYDPLEHLALAKERQRHVLDQLVANHYISDAEADAAYVQPLPLRRVTPPRPEPRRRGAAPAAP